MFLSLQTDHLSLSTADHNFPRFFQTEIRDSFILFSLWVVVYESCQCIELLLVFGKSLEELYY